MHLVPLEELPYRMFGLLFHQVKAYVPHAHVVQSAVAVRRPQYVPVRTITYNKLTFIK
jgi:hypothetical protein